VTLNFFRKIIYTALGICLIYGAWVWLRPYEWNADPAARFKIVGAQVTQDRSYFWLDVHLKKSGEDPHDLKKPVRLRTAEGVEHEPAKTDFAGNPLSGTSDIWFRFWLEEKDLRGTLSLKLNDGALSVKSSTGLPKIGLSGARAFHSTRW
jgi:hypothetical protein